MKLHIAIYSCILLFICSVSNCYAYIDPNTGGYVFQLLFPVISAVAAVYIFFKNQVTALFVKIAALFSHKRE